MSLRTDDDVARVRERIDLVELVSRYVALKRSGRNHMGLCPFHGEKTPSFSVSGERGFFHCFGCGESGDVFKFLMKIEGLTFPESLEQLAKEAGVELTRRRRDPSQDDARERALRANAVAAEYFRRALWAEKTGEAARAYLHEREIREPTAQAFGLGFAPPQGLVRALEVESVPIADADAVGLVARSREGGWYDRFRSRLMFPIHDLSGRVVGFGGRLLGGSDGPKYLNSPESVVFHKGRLLYGLSNAREATRKKDEAIVVEGYVDVLALAQAGLENVVAPLGTALTTDQVRILNRFTDRIVVLFDGDDAGRNAAARSFGVFAEAGLFADGAFLPEGDDPDTLVRRGGTAAIEERLAARTPLVDHYLASLAPRDAPLAIRQRGAVAVSDLLARTTNPIFAGFLARQASEHFGIAENQLLGRGGRRAPAPAAQAAAAPSATRDEEISLSVEESLIVELLLVEGGLRSRRLEDELGPWLSPSAATLVRRIADVGPGLDPGEFLDVLAPEARARVAAALLADDDVQHPYGNAIQAFEDCLGRLRERRRREERVRLNEAIHAAEARGDDDEVRRLQEAKMKLTAG